MVSSTIAKLGSEAVIRIVVVSIVSLTISLTYNLEVPWSCDARSIVAASDLVFQLIHDGVRTSFDGWIRSVDYGYAHFPVVHGFIVRILYNLGLRSVCGLYVALTALYTVLGSVGLVMLLEDMGVRSLAAIVAASFVYAGHPGIKIYYYTGLLVMFTAYALLPWLLLFYRRILRGDYTAARLLLFAVLLSIYMVHHPIADLMVLPMAIFYTLLWFLVNRSVVRLCVRRIVTGLFLLFLLLLPSAVVYYKFLAEGASWLFSQAAYRPVSEYWLYAAHGLLDSIAMVVRPPGQVIPPYLLCCEVFFYLVLFALVTLGFIVASRRGKGCLACRELVVVYGVLVVYVTLSMGPYSPRPISSLLIWLYAHVRLFSAIRIPSRYMLVEGFLLAVAAGLAVWVFLALDRRLHRSVVLGFTMSSFRRLVAFAVVVFALASSVSDALSLGLHDRVYSDILPSPSLAERVSGYSGYVMVLPNTVWVYPDNETLYKRVDGYVIQSKPLPQNTLLLYFALHGVNATTGGSLRGIVRYYAERGMCWQFSSLLYYLDVGRVVVDRLLFDPARRWGGGSIESFLASCGFKVLGVYDGRFVVFDNPLGRGGGGEYDGVMLCSSDLASCLSLACSSWSSFRRLFPVTLDGGLLGSGFLPEVIGVSRCIVVGGGDDVVDLVYALLKSGKRVVDLKPEIASIRRGGLVFSYYTRATRPVLLFSPWGVSLASGGSVEYSMSGGASPPNPLLMVRVYVAGRVDLGITLVYGDGFKQVYTYKVSSFGGYSREWIVVPLDRGGLVKVSLAVRGRGSVIVDKVSLVDSQDYTRALEEAEELLSRKGCIALPVACRGGCQPGRLSLVLSGYSTAYVSAYVPGSSVMGLGSWRRVNVSVTVSPLRIVGGEDAIGVGFYSDKHLLNGVEVKVYMQAGTLAVQRRVNGSVVGLYASARLWSKGLWPSTFTISVEVSPAQGVVVVSVAAGGKLLWRGAVDIGGTLKQGISSIAVLAWGKGEEFRVNRFAVMAGWQGGELNLSYGCGVLASRPKPLSASSKPASRVAVVPLTYSRLWRSCGNSLGPIPVLNGVFQLYILDSRGRLTLCYSGAVYPEIFYGYTLLLLAVWAALAVRLPRRLMTRFATAS